MDMDIVSVVIPTFNRFKYLLNTLKSIKSQTYSNIEIIVVNDCSTEKEYYEYDWKGNNIKILHLKNNTKNLFGYACAGYVRDRGIEMSTGKYIAFCDDDDSYKTDRVENIIKSINNGEERIKNSENITFAGLYESHCQKDHREHRHEYWCYCVNRVIIDFFYEIIKKYLE